MTQQDSKTSATREEDQPSKDPKGQSSAWTYRGYQLGAGDFTSAMTHLFRGEIQRSNTWRERLDSTTNWAIVATAAAISFAFSEAGGNHIVLILSAIIITILLYIESRRYRYYELWSSRVRLMETDFFATMLVPPFHPSSDWAESLAENLLQPHFTISIFEAVGRRLRRNYIWIFYTLYVAWLARLWLRPTSTTSVSVFLERASIASIPGWLVMLGYFGYMAFLTVFALVTVGLQEATGEVLPPLTEEAEPIRAEDSPFEEERQTEARDRAWFRRSQRRRQYMCLIVTDQAQRVSDEILAEMHRGVTALEATGMYSGESHKVLLCAVTVTEVTHLKDLVKGVDSDAFVVVTAAEEVLGRGFLTLEE
ncbi:MAG: DUF2270 domain-containing protein [Anaerolineales bacterium]|nr:DUF2270 domain-containing protein [Anaerolineales bacterium]